MYIMDLKNRRRDFSYLWSFVRGIHRWLLNVLVSTCRTHLMHGIFNSGRYTDVNLGRYCDYTNKDTFMNHSMCQKY